jgi:hypothetical protein
MRPGKDLGGRDPVVRAVSGEEGPEHPAVAFGGAAGAGAAALLGQEGVDDLLPS